MIVREACHHDDDAIRRVVESAFNRRAEVNLVDRLRSEGDAVISLVGVEETGVIGHVLFSKMSAPFPTLGLGPLSVAPQHQRLGAGTRLIRAGLERAEMAGWKCVFVLGNPAYYTRFGFNAALASKFICRYAGPHLMALTFGPGVSVLSGEVEYAPAFQNLG
jgi:putative acetyltransferase